MSKTLKTILILGAASLLACASSQAQNNGYPQTYPQQGQYQNGPNPVIRNQGIQQAYNQPKSTYEENELAYAISTHLGVTSESAATAIERLFRDHGRPVGYITGQEGGGALTVGAKYGKGTLWMKNGDTRKVYWQGPSVGFDVGADASKVFTLVYNLHDPDYIYQRFPGIDGSAYFVAGMAVNYQRANGIVLAPVRTGVGARLGANIGYRSYTRSRSLIPF